MEEDLLYAPASINKLRRRPTTGRGLVRDEMMDDNLSDFAAVGGGRARGGGAAAYPWEMREKSRSGRGGGYADDDSRSASRGSSTKWAVCLGVVVILALVVWFVWSKRGKGKSVGGAPQQTPQQQQQQQQQPTQEELMAMMAAKEAAAGGESMDLSDPASGTAPLSSVDYPSGETKAGILSSHDTNDGYHASNFRLGTLDTLEALSQSRLVLAMKAWDNCPICAKYANLLESLSPTLGLPVMIIKQNGPPDKDTQMPQIFLKYGSNVSQMPVGTTRATRGADVRMQLIDWVRRNELHSTWKSAQTMVHNRLTGGK